MGAVECEGTEEGDCFASETSPASQMPEDSSFRSRPHGGEDPDNKSVLSLAQSDREDSADTVAAKPEGPGLRRVREFIRKISPIETEENSGPSWQELQLEPTPTLLPELR